MSWSTKLAFVLVACICYLLLIYVHQFSEHVAFDENPSVIHIPILPSLPSDSSSGYMMPIIVENIVIVFSHSSPLDDNTATATTINIVKKASKFFQDNPSSYFVFSSSVHARIRSEAELMAETAVSMGIPKDRIKVDKDTQKMVKKATSLARWMLLDTVQFKHIYILSDLAHIHWLETTLRSVVIDDFPLGDTSRHLFHTAIPLACDTDRQELLDQMKAYLAAPATKHSEREKERVRGRLHLLQNNIPTQEPP